MTHTGWWNVHCYREMGPTEREDMADDFKHKMMSLVTVTVLMVVLQCPAGTLGKLTVIQLT